MRAKEFKLGPKLRVLFFVVVSHSPPPPPPSVDKKGNDNYTEVFANVKNIRSALLGQTHGAPFSVGMEHLTLFTERMMRCLHRLPRQTVNAHPWRRPRPG